MLQCERFEGPGRIRTHQDKAASKAIYLSFFGTCHFMVLTATVEMTHRTRIVVTQGFYANLPRFHCVSDLARTVDLPCRCGCRRSGSARAVEGGLCPHRQDSPALYRRWPRPPCGACAWKRRERPRF